MGSCFWWLAAIPFLTLQHRSCLAAGELSSSPHRSSIVGLIGDRVLLPCHLPAGLSPEEVSVQWLFQRGPQQVTVSSYDRRAPEEEPDESYQGRAEFFHSQLRAGNLSLLLKDIRSSDQGLYSCLISSQGTQQGASVLLQPAARGAVPSIHLKSHMKEGLGLSCQAEGWFPRPQLLWLDGQGQVLKELSTTKVTRMPGGLYSVLASINLQRSSALEVSCRVVNSLLNATSESRVLISEVFFPTISKWLMTFLLVLCLCMVLIFTISCKLRRSHKKIINLDKGKMEMEEGRKELSAELAKSQLRRRLGQLKVELGFWEAQSHAVAITVTADCRALELQVPGPPGVGSSTSNPAEAQALCTVPVLLGREGFAEGIHYWEVEVDQQQDWVLGVVRDNGRQEEEGRSLLGEDYWALHRSQGEVFSSEGICRAEKQQLSSSVVGVLLDLEEGRLKFYEAEQKVTMVRMPLWFGTDPAERFYPFLSKGEGTATPLIHPVPIPVPFGEAGEGGLGMGEVVASEFPARRLPEDDSFPHQAIDEAVRQEPAPREHRGCVTSSWSSLHPRHTLGPASRQC
ncbi:butyrophilin subfamily 2 member A2 [Dryobates pubescens]|uniref:butyrophilin subfamily 2 member A2 n=1 Tax=Dryobates pubescens TaxID=118200 RepID=UPI0023B9E5F5|nr:butyrophilin subfamily 2 member A2 [Dryobates pubescens]